MNLNRVTQHQEYALLRSHELPNKSPHYKHGIFPLSSWAGGCQRPLKRKVLPFFLGCPPELDDKTLLLKVPHILITELEEIKLC